MIKNVIDIHFDFQAEACGRDSDRYSPTLQEYHRILWSKTLPDGNVFTLKKISENRLYHKSNLGEFFLSSDRAVATFARRKSLQGIISQVPKAELEEFYALSNTIGGIVIWPGNRVENKMTINGIRGFNSRISDRLDLTIECIRRYYQSEDSPIYETLDRYADFFRLFKSFRGYIDFFLLQDTVSTDYTSVKLAPPFDNFATKSLPKNVEEYLQYKNEMTKYIIARNARIASLSRNL